MVLLFAAVESTGQKMRPAGLSEADANHHSYYSMSPCARNLRILKKEGFLRQEAGIDSCDIIDPVKNTEGS
jgi:hypothetical protein